MTIDPSLPPNSRIRPGSEYNALMREFELDSSARSDRGRDSRNVARSAGHGSRRNDIMRHATFKRANV